MTRLERIAAKPIRRCRTLHHCELCNQAIRDGERYHDGGYGMRAHVECVGAGVVARLAELEATR